VSEPDLKLSLWAYCDRGGVVHFGPDTPKGMLPLAAMEEGGDVAAWTKVILDHCQPIGFLFTPEGKKERVYSVPGIREAEGNVARTMAALKIFHDAISEEIRRPLGSKP